MKKYRYLYFAAFSDVPLHQDIEASSYMVTPDGHLVFYNGNEPVGTVAANQWQSVFVLSQVEA